MIPMVNWLMKILKQNRKLNHKIDERYTAVMIGESLKYIALDSLLIHVKLGLITIRKENYNPHLAQKVYLETLNTLEISQTV